MSDHEYMAEGGSELGATAPRWHAIHRNEASGQSETLREPDGSRRKFKSQAAALGGGMAMGLRGNWL